MHVQWTSGSRNESSTQQREVRLKDYRLKCRKEKVSKNAPFSKWRSSIRISGSNTIFSAVQQEVMKNNPDMENNRKQHKRHEFRIVVALLRMASLFLAIISIALLVSDEQTSSVPLSFFGLSKPILLNRTAKFSLIKGLRFVVDAMAIAAGYTLVHLIINIVSIAMKRSVVFECNGIAWASFIGDSIVAYLIVSAAAVATEIGYLAERGAPDVMWMKVCNYFTHFCKVYAISVLFSFLTALVSFIIVAISSYHLFSYKQHLPQSYDA